MKGEVKVRWMLVRVSSGNWAKVAEVYHGRGTRSQKVRGLAEILPGSISTTFPSCCAVRGDDGTRQETMGRDKIWDRGSHDVIFWSTGKATKMWTTTYGKLLYCRSEALQAELCQ